jgi:hypothetical protein
MKTTFRTFRWGLQLVWRACVIVILVAHITYSQDASQKVLEAIPEPFRPQLVERLALFVEYQRTKQYDKLYDLLSQSSIHTVFKDQTKEEFAKAYQTGDVQRTSTRLIEFLPTATQQTQAEAPGVYVIYGAATMCQMGELTKKPRVAVTAQLQDGKWYFSPAMDVLVD